MTVRFRIRTSAGQELSFASDEMFEDFVRSGDLSPDDLVYDAESGSWAPSRTHPIVLEIEYEKEEAAEAAAKKAEPSAENAFGLKLADAQPVPEEPDAQPGSGEGDDPSPDVSADSEVEPVTDAPETSSEDAFGLALAPEADMMSPEEASRAFVEKMEAERSSQFDVGGQDQGGMLGFTMDDSNLLKEAAAPKPTPPPPPRPATPRREPAARPDSDRSSERPGPPQRKRESRGRGRTVVMAVVGIGVLGTGGYFGLQFATADRTDVAPDTVQTVTPVPVETPPDPPPREPVIANTAAAIRERAQERFLAGTQNELRDLQPVPEAFPGGEYFSFPSDHPEVFEVWQDYLTTIRRVRGGDEDRFTEAFEAALDDAAVTGAERQARLTAAIIEFDASLVLRDAHYDRVEALATAAIQSHNALVEAEGLILFDATGATGAPGPVGRGTSGRDADAQLLLDQVIDLLTGTLEADGLGPRQSTNVRAWVWDGFLDAVTN
jgi:hypothetical protein